MFKLTLQTDSPVADHCMAQLWGMWPEISGGAVVVRSGDFDRLADYRAAIGGTTVTAPIEYVDTHAVDMALRSEVGYR